MCTVELQHLKPSEMSRSPGMDRETWSPSQTHLSRRDVSRPSLVASANKLTHYS